MKTKILEVTANDEFILQVREELLANPIKGKYEDYRVDQDGLLLYKYQLYIPSNYELRKQVLDELHPVSYSVHPRYQKTVTVAKSSYF